MLLYAEVHRAPNDFFRNQERLDVSKFPRIIFVCVGNSCRSQMAQGFFNHYAQQRGLPLTAESAGTRPAGYVHPTAIQVMRERGVDISHHTSKGISPAQWLGYNYVITMGCSDKDACPVNFKGVTRDWGIEDPFDQPVEAYRRARDEIERKVLALLDEVV